MTFSHQRNYGLVVHSGLFKVLFGEKNAHKAMTIFVALWVIFFGFALLFNLISL
jgi:hypothetical protein